MKIVSVNTGQPKSYTLDGKTIETSMVRVPQSQITVEKKQVLGDVFTSPNIHGVPEAVVYALSVDRYDYWSEYLGQKVGIGFFGENLSVDELREETILLGDEYQVGTCLLRARAPRYPCARLNFVSGRTSTREHFAEMAWPGVYFEVLQEGTIKPGDALKLKKRVQEKISILDFFMALRATERQEPISDLIYQVLNSDLVSDKHKMRIRRIYG